MPLALQLAYDGSDFHGFQRLPGQRTVQGELEQTLQRLLKQPCPVVCAGRTDAGVHAWGQIVSLETELPFAPERLPALLAHHLPPDISLRHYWQLPAGFHARFCALARHYRYRLSTQADPFAHRYRWQCGPPLVLASLQAAWQQCEGEWDFSALARPDPNRRSGRLRVFLAQVRPMADGLELDMIADRFLHTLVRRLVGTALDMARGRLPADYLSTVLSGAHQPAQPEGRLAPAHGLYFCRALYPERWGLTVAYPDPLPDPPSLLIPTAQKIWWD
jgi:tRNA pseudouridine38-40 synthase